MNKKAVLVIGIIAIAGIGYYLYSRRSTSTTETNLGDGSVSGDATKSASAPKMDLTRKDKKQLCGRKPLLNKAKKEAWQRCVDAGGVASSFDGDFDYGL
jgi:hypothetical protein